MKLWSSAAETDFEDVGRPLDVGAAELRSRTNPCRKDHIAWPTVSRAAVRRPVGGDLFERPFHQGPRLLGGRRNRQLGLARLREQRVVGRVAKAPARERDAERAQVLDRVVALTRALQRAHQRAAALVEQLVDQVLLVDEVVVDGRRRVAAALGEPAHREGIGAVLDEQRLGRVENGAAGFVAVLEPATCGGLERSHADPRGLRALRRPGGPERCSERRSASLTAFGERSFSRRPAPGNPETPARLSAEVA